MLEEKVCSLGSEKNKKKLHFHEFFYEFMKAKFKTKKLIEQRTEQVVESIIRYAGSDPRVEIVRKFLNIGDNSIKRVLYESFFLVLKSYDLTRFASGLRCSVR